MLKKETIKISNTPRLIYQKYTRLRSFQVFYFLFAIPKTDLEMKKAPLNEEVCPESIETMY